MFMEWMSPVTMKCQNEMGMDEVEKPNQDRGTEVERWASYALVWEIS